MTLDKRTLIKNITASFLPLLVFILVDEIFSLTVSLIIALTVGLIELGITYWREQRWDKFILLDVALIGVLGLVSILMVNPFFILIKPAIIEAIFMILIGVTLFTNNPILIKMSSRYLGGVEPDAPQLFAMRRMLFGLFWLFLGHVGMIIAAAFYVGAPATPQYLERKEVWAFVSGGLLYIALGAIFGGQFLFNKFKSRRFLKQYAHDEWFDLVTPEGKVIGKAPRRRCHGNPNLLHPVVHLHIFSAIGELWLQKRAETKEIAPGKWDTSVGGHVMSGETSEQALVRELREEVGLEHLACRPLYRYLMQNEIESELVYTFHGYHNGPFQFPAEEIQAGKFWKIKDIRANLGKGVFTSNFEQEFKMLTQIKMV